MGILGASNSGSAPKHTGSYLRGGLKRPILDMRTKTCEPLIYRTWVSIGIRQLAPKD